jgi:hypothetical protein
MQDQRRPAALVCTCDGLANFIHMCGTTVRSQIARCESTYRRVCACVAA